MAKYATGTTVSAQKTADEIRDLLVKRGVTKWGMLSDGDAVHLMFEFNNLSYRLSLPPPDPADKSIYIDGRGYNITNREKAYQQEVGRRWRSLLLYTKARLVAVEDGIVTFEEAFIPNALTQGGQTVAEAYVPQLRCLAESGRLPGIMPAALPGRSE